MIRLWDHGDLNVFIRRVRAADICYFSTKIRIGFHYRVAILFLMSFLNLIYLSMIFEDTVRFIHRIRFIYGGSEEMRGPLSDFVMIYSEFPA